MQIREQEVKVIIIFTKKVPFPGRGGESQFSMMKNMWKSPFGDWKIEGQGPPSSPLKYDYHYNFKGKYS